MKKLMLVAVLALTTVLLLPSVASAKTPTLKKLAKTVAALQKKVNAQATTIASQATQLATQAATIATLTSRLTTDEATIATQGQQLADATPLLAIAPYVSLGVRSINGVAGPNIVFKGANLQIKSTTSETDDSGTGNLIVGWDPLPNGTLPTPFRTGSNNLVVGTANNFTSCGGFVAGVLNTVSNQYASVSGGAANTASGPYSSISGGYSNVASGAEASVSGGFLNQAVGPYSSISGGYSNVASGTDASVSGGLLNQAAGSFSSISGGQSLTESADSGWAGGSYHTP